MNKSWIYFHGEETPSAVTAGMVSATNEIVSDSWCTMERFVELAEQHGFEVRQRSTKGWHRLAYAAGNESVHVEVVPEGRKSPRDPDFAPATPGPSELGVPRGLGFVSFDGWVQMKLVSNREKDRYHLIEVLKLANESQIADAVSRLRHLNPTYLREFQRLLEMAQAENQETWEFGRRGDHHESHE